MRTYLIIFGIFAWVTWGLFWGLPLKRKLLKIHGADKTNDYLIELAKQGDPDAKLLYKRTKILLAVGVVGGAIITLTKYF